MCFQSFCLPHTMSKAPQGVFQEELEWCISQLEADLHLTPHPKLGMFLFISPHSPCSGLGCDLADVDVFLFLLSFIFPVLVLFGICSKHRTTLGFKDCVSGSSFIFHSFSVCSPCFLYSLSCSFFSPCNDLFGSATALPSFFILRKYCASMSGPPSPVGLFL